jgi:putative ABC transport system substrate-binding protein
VKRRDFITLLGGAAAAWPLAARAQQPAKLPIIGFLGGGSAEAFAHVVAAFGQGLYETGFAEGQNVTIEYRWAEGQYDRLPALVAELVGRPVVVIVATGGDVGVRAAKKATTTIPIVFTSGSDPVAAGFVSSLNRPGGNVTGVSLFVSVLEVKKLDLLRELVPTAAVIAFLLNPSNPRARCRYSGHAGGSARPRETAPHIRSRQGTRLWRGLYEPRSTAGRRPCCSHRAVLSEPARSSGGTGGAPFNSHDLWSP